MLNKLFKCIITITLAIVLCTSSLLSNVIIANAGSPSVLYKTHCENIGWTGYSSNNAVSGTTGRALQMEAIKIKLSGVTGGIMYSSHIQNIGWTNWVYNNTTSGTTGRALQMEAIKIKLYGDVAKKYSIQYRVHCQDIGWTRYVSDGAVAGTTGQNRQIEAIQIKLVAKNIYKLYTENSYITVTYNCNTFDQWKRAVKSKELSLMTNGRYVNASNGFMYYTGKIILNRKVLSYKKINVKLPLAGPGAPYRTCIIKIPYKVQYTLHKHKLNNKVTEENIGKLIVGLMEQEIRWTQYCSCGMKRELTWTIPVDDNSSKNDYLLPVKTLYSNVRPY